MKIRPVLIAALAAAMFIGCSGIPDDSEGVPVILTVDFPDSMSGSASAGETMVSAQGGPTMSADGLIAPPPLARVHLKVTLTNPDEMFLVFDYVTPEPVSLFVISGEDRVLDVEAYRVNPGAIYASLNADHFNTTTPVADRTLSLQGEPVSITITMAGDSITGTVSSTQPFKVHTTSGDTAIPTGGCPPPDFYANVTDLGWGLTFPSIQVDVSNGFTAPLFSVSNLPIGKQYLVNVFHNEAGFYSASVGTLAGITASIPSLYFTGYTDPSIRFTPITPITGMAAGSTGQVALSATGGWGGFFPFYTGEPDTCMGMIFGNTYEFTAPLTWNTCAIYIETQDCKGNFTTNTINAGINALVGPWHVSTNGDDFNGRGSQAQPWFTINHAIDMALPGDEIRVAAGVYAEALSFYKDLTLKGGYDTSTWQRNVTVHHSVVESPAGPSPSDLITVHYGSNVTIDGMVLRNGKNGIFNKNSNVTVSNNIIMNNQDAGVFTYSYAGMSYEPTAHSTLSHNLIFNNFSYGIKVKTYGFYSYTYSTCYYASAYANSTNDTIVSPSYTLGVYASGEYDVHCFGFEFDGYGAVIRNDIVSDSSPGTDISIHDWTNSRVDYTCVPGGSFSPTYTSNITYEYPVFWVPMYGFYFNHTLQPDQTCCFDNGDPAIRDPDNSVSDRGFTGGNSIWFDRDYDGMPDIWETYYGLDPNNPADATANLDGDTAPNREEFSQWRNPLVAD